MYILRTVVNRPFSARAEKVSETQEQKEILASVHPVISLIEKQLGTYECVVLTINEVIFI